MTAAAKNGPRRYALLGSGRLARHLGHYFRAEGLEMRAWARRPDPAFNDLDLSAHADPDSRLEAAVEDCTHVLLLLSDDAIEPFVRRHACLRGRILIHCSGALALDAVPGAHPLMTFADALYPDELYRRIPFVTDADGPGFAELFPDLANPGYALAREKKALYHAYCVASGNFTSLLWERVFREFEAELGLPKAALLPYADRIGVRDNDKVLLKSGGVSVKFSVRVDDNQVTGNVWVTSGYDEGTNFDGRFGEVQVERV